MIDFSIDSFHEWPASLTEKLDKAINKPLAGEHLIESTKKLLSDVEQNLSKEQLVILQQISLYMESFPNKAVGYKYEFLTSDPTLMGLVEKGKDLGVCRIHSVRHSPMRFSFEGLANDFINAQRKKSILDTITSKQEERQSKKRKSS